MEDCLGTCALCLLCRPYTGECQAPCRHMHPSLPTPNVLLPPLPVSWAIQQLRAGFSIPEHQRSISEATLRSQSHSQSTVWSAMLTVAGASQPFLTPVCCCITVYSVLLPVAIWLNHVWLDVMLNACVACCCAGIGVGIQGLLELVSAFAAVYVAAVKTCSSGEGSTMTCPCD